MSSTVLALLSSYIRARNVCGPLWGRQSSITRASQAEASQAGDGTQGCQLEVSFAVIQYCDDDDAFYNSEMASEQTEGD